MYSIIKKTIKAILFILIFMMLYVPCREVLRDKSEGEGLGRVFSMPNETYDVVLAGPSHIQYGIQPAILEDEYGIIACNTATAAQSIPTTYYVVKEMIDRHTPKLVIVDLFCLFYDDAYLNSARFHQAIDNFPLNKNKAEAIINLVDEDRDEYFINLMLYHGRWKSLTRDDYMSQKEYDEKWQTLDITTPYENDFVPVDKNITADIPEISLKYLKKIANLCKETDTELIFTVIPYRADMDNNSVTAVYQQSLYNKVGEYAEKWGVEYINLLHRLDDIGFDFSTDMAEFSHLNESGCKKVSRYMGELIKERIG